MSKCLSTKSLFRRIAFSFILICAYSLFVSSGLSYACRFWCAIGKDVPSEQIRYDLSSASASLKVLGKTYPDGWSVGCYIEGDAKIFRGSMSSFEDEKFNEATHIVSDIESHIYFAHLRRASSGCVEGVPNPHPFRHTRGGKNWIFGHNGGMSKEMLIDLIGKDYLDKYPPKICNENPPETWIDSELYFLFLLKHMQENDWDRAKGIKEALQALYAVLPDDERYLNFFLSDGTTLWIFRKGRTLYYRTRPGKDATFVTSTPPDPEDTDWLEFPENQIGIFASGADPEFISIRHK